jgi:EmrB/QacA subfamily drug resistance transporter
MTSALALPRSVPVSQNRWAALAVLMAGTFMIVLDFFIVNVALPSMQSDLHASTSAIEWVVAGYGLTFATCLITAGRIGDRIGRRRAFTIGLSLFTLASIACGLAPDPRLLIAARLLQGLAAALISPNVLAIIGVAYQGPDRVRALTVYGMVMGFAAAGAQLIGGALVQADVAGAGWRTVFLINVPVGLAAVLLAPSLLSESRASREGARIDLVGTLLITSGLTALLLPLVEGRQQGFPAWTWLSLGLAPILLGVFVIHQLRLARQGGRPLLEPHLFRARSFSAGLVTQLAFWSGMASFFVVLALYLQEGRGLNALQAGMVFTVLACAYLVTSLRAPRLTLKYGRRLILVGALTLAAGYALILLGVGLAAGTEGFAWIPALVPGLALAGAGMGLCITPLVATVLSSVQPEHAGAASGILSTVQQLGNALGVAITGLVFFGALAQGSYSSAFELALGEFVILLVGVAALSRLLPRGAHA